MNLHSDLDLENNNLIFTQNTPTDTVETVMFDCMNPHCDPELEEIKPIILYNTLASDDVLPYQVWLQKVQQLRRYHPDEHSL